MADTTTLSKADLIARWDRAKKSAARMRQEGEAITARGLRGMLTVSGGATVGCMRGLWGDTKTGDVMIPGTEVEADAAVGTLVSLGATLGLAGEASDYAAAYGYGILAAVTAREVEGAFKKAAPKK